LKTNINISQGSVKKHFRCGGDHFTAVCHCLTDEPAQFVRYAKSLSLHIEMRPDNSGHIYAPYLEIDYRFVSRHNMTKTSASVSCHLLLL